MNFRIKSIFQLEKIITFLSSIWVIGAMLTVPVIWIIPDFFDEYIVEEIEKEPSTTMLTHRAMTYANVDDDVEFERIEIGKLKEDNHYRLCLTINESADIRILKADSSTFKGRHRLHVDDLNEDGRAEIYVISKAEGRLFLNIWEPFNQVDGIYNNDPVAIEINDPQKNIHENDWSYVLKSEFVDTDNNGIKEFIFILYSYEKKLSLVVLYDPEANTFRFSDYLSLYPKQILPEFHEGQFKRLLISGINNKWDEERNIFYGNSQVYSLDVMLKFDLLRTINELADYLVLPIEDGHYLTLQRNLSDMSRTTLAKLNSQWGILDTISFVNDIPVQNPFLNQLSNEKNFAYSGGKRVVQISNNLEIQREIELEIKAKNLMLLEQIDYNEDGKMDHLLSDFKTGEVFIYTNQFNHRISLGLMDGPQHIGRHKTIKNHFYLQDLNHSYIYRFEANPVRYLKYPIALGIYIILVVLVFLIRKSQENIIRKKYETKETIRDLQLRLVSNELNPHFIFNTFNSIGSVVKSGNSEEGYDLIVHFSKMMRNALKSGNDLSTTLGDEIKFIEDYMVIQRLRFKDRFDFQINVHTDLDQSIKIPKLLFQVHVENAIKHGFAEVKPEAKLTLRIERIAEGCKIEITDNGIGRGRATELKTGGTGKGLKIINELIKIHNQKLDTHISQIIKDRKNTDGKPNGTSVFIEIKKK